VVDVFIAIANIIEAVSPTAVSSYVISMTRNASHVLEVSSA
jgi:phosphoenolpyruvate carboxylase